MSGNRVTVAGELLVIEPKGLDRWWSFTRRLEIPLRHVKHAFFDPTSIPEPGGWRWPGLRLPWKVAGTFITNGRKEFWNISGYDRAIVIQLDEVPPFGRLVLTVDEPLRVVDAVNAARSSSLG